LLSMAAWKLNHVLSQGCIPRAQPGGCLDG